MKLTLYVAQYTQLAFAFPLL